MSNNFFWGGERSPLPVLPCIQNPRCMFPTHSHTLETQISYCSYRQIPQIPVDNVDTGSYCRYRQLLWIPVDTVDTGRHRRYRQILQIPVDTVDTGRHCRYRQIRQIPVDTVDTGFEQRNVICLTPSQCSFRNTNKFKAYITYHRKCVG